MFKGFKVGVQCYSLDDGRTWFVDHWSRWLAQAIIHGPEYFKPTCRVSAVDYEQGKITIEAIK